MSLSSVLYEKKDKSWPEIFSSSWYCLLLHLHLMLLVEDPFTFSLHLSDHYPCFTSLCFTYLLQPSLPSTATQPSGVEHPNIEANSTHHGFTSHGFAEYLCEHAGSSDCFSLGPRLLLSNLYCQEEMNVRSPKECVTTATRYGECKQEIKSHGILMK